MALFNEILEGGLNQVVVKRLGMQVGSAVPAVQPELAVDLTLESDRPEWGWLKGEYRYGIGRALAAPAAGIHAGVLIENPSNSGVLLVAQNISVSAQARISLSSTLLGSIITSGNGNRNDGRQPASSRAGWSDLGTATANLLSAHDILWATSYSQTPYVVPPGFNLYVHAFTAATALSCGVTWTERPVLPGELG